MADPIVHGPGYSTYVRTVRITLQEKGVAYQHNDFDFLKGMPEDHLQRHPFGKVPAFEHDGFCLFETSAICRYVDEAFDGPALQPADVKARGRMAQIISSLDSYIYGPTVGTVVIQRLVTPMLGGTPDEDAIKAALPEVEKGMTILDKLLGEQKYLAGDDISLADFHLIPIFTYFSMTPDGAPIMDKIPNLRRWWEAASSRESSKSTEPKLG